MWLFEIFKNSIKEGAMAFFITEGIIAIVTERVNEKVTAVGRLIKHLKKHEVEGIDNYTERLKTHHGVGNILDCIEHVCFLCKQKRPDISTIFNFFNHIRRDHKEIKYHEDEGKFVCPFCGESL